MSERPLAGWAYWLLNGALAVAHWSFAELPMIIWGFYPKHPKKGGSTIPSTTDNWPDGYDMIACIQLTKV